MAQPWQTLAKINGYQLLPGSRILLHCGDTWNEMLLGNGNGTWDHATFDSVYASTFATKKAAYLADTAYHDVLISDGEDSTTANSDADGNASDKAIADALDAAHAAVNASSANKWITLTSYGTGARPLIQPGGTTHAGTKFANNTPAGWNITGVDFDSCYVAGILYDNGDTATPAWRGFRLTNSKITNCTGMPVRTSGGPFPGLVAPYNQFCAQGITLARGDGIYIENVEIANVDSPCLFLGAANVRMKTISMHDVWVESFGFGPHAYNGSQATISNIAIDDLTATNFFQAANPGGFQGFFKGESGFLIAGANGFLLRNVSITHVKVIHADGVPADFEISDASPDPYAGSLISCTFTDNDGAAFLFNDTVSYAGHRVLMDQCTLARNDTSARPAILAWRATGNHIAITRSSVTRQSSQHLWSGTSANVYASLTDVTPTGILFGASNTVI